MKRVLLIEDDPEQAEALKAALQETDNVIEVALTGADGLDRARQLRPDVVLCDLGLPDMDGYEVARRMRADPELACIHLFALTAYAFPENKEEWSSAGFEDRLVKPPSFEDLERRIQQAPPKCKS